MYHSAVDLLFPGGVGADVGKEKLEDLGEGADYGILCGVGAVAGWQSGGLRTNKGASVEQRPGLCERIF